MRPALGTRVGDLYLRWALEIPSDGEALLRDRIFTRLPERILDCHAHVNGRVAAADLSPYGWAQRRSSFPEWDFPSHEAALGLLYAGRSVRTIWMPQPHKGVDHKRANRYILEHKTADDFATLCGLPDDPTYTIEQIFSGSYVALKMYPHYVEPPYRHVVEYFPHWALEAVVECGMPIILHLPAPLSQCYQEVLDLVTSFPDLRIVLAHLGRESQPRERTATVLRDLAGCRNIVMDMSMATNRPLHALALATLGPDRILYGSDEPFNLLRYIEIDDPEGGRAVVSHHDYHWNKPWARQRYGERARGAPLVHFQALAALIDALDEVFGDEADGLLKGLFWDNAHRVFPLTTRFKSGGVPHD